MIGDVNDMRANTIEITQADERLREYQRQQDRLKAMTSNAEKMKSVSADLMIKNLLKQNFLKPNNTVTGNTSFDNKINLGMNLPNWLECDSSAVPAVYKHLWSLVKTENNFADTNRVSQLLLTSGLQTEVLGFIWNLSNKQVPGQLSKQEFYIILTLVGLAQIGYTFTNLSILNSVTTAPIPVLQTKVLEKCVAPPCTTNNVYSSDFSQAKVSNEEMFLLTSLAATKLNDFPILTNTSLTNTSNNYENSLIKDPVEAKIQKKFSNLGHSKGQLDLNDSNLDCSKTSNFPFIGSSPTAELEDDEFSEFHSAFVNDSATDIKSDKDDSMSSSHSDEFTDFQSADISVDPLQTMIIGQKKEIPRIPLPKTLNGKLSNLRTNILKISPESEKKLKFLSQSESLSTLPESRISASNRVSAMPNIPVVGGSKDVGMRLANHSLGSNSEMVKNQKHLKHKQPYSVADLSFPHKCNSIDELFPKCFQKNPSSKTFVLKETKIRTIETVETEFPSKLDAEVNLDISPSKKNTRKIEIPILGTFNETTLPTQSDTFAQKQETIELFSTEEDKYSALREIELEMKQVQNETANVSNSEGNDEFGEFLSADLSFETPAKDDDLWGEWNILEETNVDKRKHSENISDFKVDVSKSCENISLNQNIFSFDLLSLSEETDKKSEDADASTRLKISNDSKLEENGISSMSINKFDLRENNLPFERDQNYEDFITLDDVEYDKSNFHPESSLNKNVCESNFDESEQDFGEFLTSNLNSTDKGALQKCDSLPSLDLNMTPVKRNDQEIIRKKCLLTCLHLMQQALQIFSRVSSTAVLAEVFSTQEAVNYVNCLNIVCHISRRVCVNCNEISSVQEEIERIWQKLITYCYEFGISLKEDVDNCIQIGMQCNLCLGFVGNDVIDQGPTSYHPSCANLWVNCIDSVLPCPV